MRRGVDPPPKTPKRHQQSKEPLRGWGGRETLALPLLHFRGGSGQSYCNPEHRYLGTNPTEPADGTYCRNKHSSGLLLQILKWCPIVLFLGKRRFPPPHVLFMERNLFILELFSHPPPSFIISWLLFPPHSFGLLKWWHWYSLGELQISGSKCARLVEPAPPLSPSRK